MQRKIIQICCALSEAPGSLGRERLYALCDDGTLWLLKPPGTKDGPKWLQIQNVPDNIRTVVDL